MFLAYFWDNNQDIMTLLWAIKEVGDAWEQILVFLYDFFEASKVSAEIERAVYLSSEEDWSTMR